MFLKIIPEAINHCIMGSVSKIKFCFTVLLLLLPYQFQQVETAIFNIEAMWSLLFKTSISLKDASLQDFPYQVGVYVDGGLKCGGALLQEDLVLTAASCVYDAPTQSWIHFPRIFVKAGDYNLTMTDPNEQKLSVLKIYSPPKFFVKDGHIAHDIVLLRLKGSFQLSHSVKPVTLPKSRNSIHNPTSLPTSGTVVVWGKRKETSQSKALHKFQISFEKGSECSRKFQTVGYHSALQVCSKPIKKISCRGSNGTPLLTGSQMEFYGIVNYGLSCGKDSEGVVITRVAPYVPWIKKVMEQNSRGRSGSNHVSSHFGYLLFLFFLSSLLPL